jgi:protein SCO1/2
MTRFLTPDLKVGPTACFGKVVGPTFRSGVHIVVFAIALMAAPLSAQMTGAPAPGYRTEVGQPASAIPAPLRQLAFDQRIGEQAPLDVTLRDESGRADSLRSYLDGKPAVLAFVYYECPMLCTQVLRGLSSTIKVLGLEPGVDFDVILVSIDPRETPEVAARRKASHLAREDAAHTAGWHFLTGDEPEIRRLADAAGFRYAWDEATQQYAHPAGLAVLTPDGRFARYLFGLEYGPRDLRLALVEASEGTLGTAVDAFLLYCYHYDPMSGGYGLAIMNALRVAGVATVLALGGFVAIMLRRERRLDPEARSPKPAARSPKPVA